MKKEDIYCDQNTNTKLFPCTLTFLQVLSLPIAPPIYKVTLSTIQLAGKPVNDIVHV